MFIATNSIFISQPFYIHFIHFWIGEYTLRNFHCTAKWLICSNTQLLIPSVYRALAFTKSLNLTGNCPEKSLRVLVAWPFTGSKDFSIPCPHFVRMRPECRSGLLVLPTFSTHMASERFFPRWECVSAYFRPLTLLILLYGDIEAKPSPYLCLTCNLFESTAMALSGAKVAAVGPAPISAALMSINRDTSLRDGGVRTVIPHTTCHLQHHPTLPTSLLYILLLLHLSFRL